jgi:hypothetical protein
MLSQIHYDPPISHTQKQTRWQIPQDTKVVAQSIKILDLYINPTTSTPNTPCYFPVLVGAYGCIKKVQIGLDGRIVDVWDVQELLPYLVAMSADNEKNFGINSVLYKTGNNLELDESSGLLTFNRPVVDSTPATLNLNVYSGLLNSIGVINSKLEIIIDWETSNKKWLIPNAGTVTSISIAPPLLSYETLNSDIAQPDNVPYVQWERDNWIIPQNPNTATSGLQKVDLRSSGFNNKTLGRMLLSTCPTQIQNLAPGDEMKDLFKLHGYYMSTPMFNETFNLAKNGRSLLTSRGVVNDALKHALAVDTWGEGCFSTGAHINSKSSVLKELQTANILTGYASYGCIEVNNRVEKDFEFVYNRANPIPTGAGALPNNHALNDQLSISAVSEVECILRGGEKVYV